MKRAKRKERREKMLTDRKTDRQTDRQKYRQPNRQTYRQRREILYHTLNEFDLSISLRTRAIEFLIKYSLEQILIILGAGKKIQEKKTPLFSITDT